MDRTRKYSRAILKLLVFGIFGAITLVLRHIVKTPQVLKSVVPGIEHLYKWTSGYIFYKIIGVEGATPVVLLHTPEIGGSSYEMRHLATRLAPYYRVYILDLLGFGLSDRPKINYSAHTYVELCRDFLKDVVQQPTILVASGESAQYAVEVAASSPDLCGRLVLLSPSIHSGEEQTVWYRRLLANTKVGLFFYACLMLKPLLCLMLARRHGLKYGQITADEITAVQATAYQLGAEHAVLSQLMGQLNLDVSQQIQKLSQPVLVIMGTPATQGRQSEQTPMRYFSSAKQVTAITLPDVGLCIHEAVPTEVATSIVNWVTPRVEVPEAVLQTPAVEPLTEQKEEMKLTAPVKPIEEHVTESSSDLVVEEESLPQVEAYCVKCRQKRTIHNAKKTVTKNGRSALEGTCPVCTTRLFRFIAG